jgi:hypothetical protein
MKRRLIYGLAAIALLAGANVAYALTALGSSAVQHGGRAYANRVIADVGRKVCDMLVDAICWADR